MKEKGNKMKLNKKGRRKEKRKEENVKVRKKNWKIYRIKRETISRLDFYF